jgi:hypothetical protein
MSAVTAIKLVWAVFLVLILAGLVIPASAQAPQIDFEIRYHLDEKSGLAVLREKDLLLMQSLNQQLADEVLRLRDKTGCL